MKTTIHYFYNQEIYEFENQPGKGYNFGTDITEENTLIPLTEEQCNFHKQYPTASALEVWNTSLIENQVPAYEDILPIDLEA